MLSEGFSKSGSLPGFSVKACWIFDCPLVSLETSRLLTSFWMQDISLVMLRLIDTNKRNLIFGAKSRKEESGWQLDMPCGSLMIPTKLFNFQDNNFLFVWVDGWIHSLSLKHMRCWSSNLSAGWIQSVTYYMITLPFIIIKSHWQHRFPWLSLSLSIHPYHTLLLASLADYIIELM